MPSNNHHPIGPLPLLLWFLLGLLPGCAMKVAPTGGPRDTTPAEVVSVDPASGATRFTGDEIRFSFDDYVDRAIRNAITILPTVRFSVSYAGDEIAVEFQDSLTANTTYSVTIGTDWSDVRGNRPLAAFSTIFSTGPAIDTGVITGLVSAKSLTNVTIFCYPWADTSAPFTSWDTPPRYRLPCGVSGTFTIRGLADGRYRVLAVRDENRNGLVDAAEDFAVVPADVVVLSASSQPVHLKLGPAIDRDPPVLTRARALTSQLLTLQFTEPALPTPTWQRSLEVRSARDSVIPAVAVWPDPLQSDRLLVRLAAPIDTGACPVIISAGMVRDSAGNRADTAQRTSMRGVSTADTISLRVLSIEPRDSSRNVLRSQPIVITFSDAVDTMNAQITVEHRAPQGAVQVRTRWASPISFVIEPQEAREVKTWYATTLRFADVRSAIGRSVRDTSVVLSVLTEERPVDPGSITGRFVPSEQMRSCSPLVIRLLASNGNVAVSFRPDADGSFRVERLPAGEYTADVFCDRNSNGIYDHGDLRPFRFGEQWWPLPTKISVRPRWTLENVSINP